MNTIRNDGSPAPRRQIYIIMFLCLLITVGNIIYTDTQVNTKIDKASQDEGNHDQISSVHVGNYEPHTASPQLRIQEETQDIIFINSTKQEQNINAGHVDRDSPAILPLLPWEIKAIETRECAPENGIPEYCCPGSFSEGGGLKYKPDICNKTQVYRKVQDYTMQYLQTKYPQEEQGICDVCKIVDHLFENNLTLSFVGDSMTRQSENGFECELARRGYHVYTERMPWEKRESCAGWRYCIKSKLKIMVTKKGYDGNDGDDKGRGLGRVTAETNKSIYYYGLYRPDPDPTNMEIKEEIISNSDIVVFDHGLHWKPAEVKTFSSAMINYLRNFVGSNLTLLAWRETSSQHFDAKGGHYGRPRASNECVPIMNKKTSDHQDDEQQEEEGFRMPLMRNFSNHVGLSWKNVQDLNFTKQIVEPNELIFVPFREYTVPLDYLHPGECTHYCHTPYLWLPLWRNLRIAMDRAIKNVSSLSTP